MYEYKFEDTRLTAWFLLSMTYPAIYKLVERRAAKTGLTWEKAKVLWICTDYPSPLTPAELSRLMFRESHSVSGLLDRMERDGLVKRVPKRKGHPFTDIQITPKGEKMVRPIKDVMIPLVDEMMSVLSQEELNQLIPILRKVRDAALDRLHIELRPWPGRGWGPCKASEPNEKTPQKMTV